MCLISLLLAYNRSMRVELLTPLLPRVGFSCGFPAEHDLSPPSVNGLQFAKCKILDTNLACCILIKMFLNLLMCSVGTPEKANFAQLV